jgi:hypothetical protein
MDSAAKDPIPGSSITPEQILDICRTNVTGSIKIRLGCFLRKRMGKAYATFGMSL